MIVSVSLESDMHHLLKNTSKQMGCSVSALVRQLVDKYLGLLSCEDEIPVVFRVPSNLKGDDLKKWLAIKSEALANALQKLENSSD